ncbi:hypothetical protein LR48_Vigan10g201300 [Vigna angularis]|uniref:Uncharacterized protein n=1 Tax=Phaseolus angularis TaxID=3914 RepID=A0A0L9VM30_PHAAN|nr:hypothetical protein LR48_Vigan10g201300 [Vigna angularis]
MASSSQPKRIKSVARKARAPTLDGWISDYDAQNNLIPSSKRERGLRKQNRG